MAIAGTAILKKKDKIISTFAVGTILTPFYLLAMEATINKYFLSQPVYWFRTIAFPVVCVWLVVIWMTLLLIRFTKMNNAYCIGIGFVLATMGSVLTNWVVLNERGKTLLASSWIGAFCCIVCAVMAFVIGGRLKKEGQK